MTDSRGHLRREGRTWRLVLRHAASPNGDRRRSSVRLGTVRELPTKREARAAADRWIAATHPQQLTPGAVVDWAAWCDRYVAEVLIMHAKGTRDSQASIIRNHLRPAFSGPVHKITPDKVQAWLVGQRASGAPASTIGARFRVLRRLLREAAARGVGASPPSAGKLLLPKDEVARDSIERKAFTPTEAASILEAAPIAEGTAYAIALLLGLRVGEVLGLTWPAVDLDTGLVTVRQQAIDGRLAVLKTPGSQATLRAPAPLLAKLRAYREAWHPNPAELLFANADGKPWPAAALRVALHGTLDRLGIRRRGVHAFRHACAIAMASAGVNPEAMRRALRHSSLRVTAVYLRASPEDVAAGLERGSQALDSAVHAYTLLGPTLYAGLSRRGHVAMAVGAQVPVAGTRPFDWRFGTFLLWEWSDGPFWAW